MKKLGKYKLLNELSRDDFTILYQARDMQTDREVILKVISVVDLHQPEFADQFIKSAKIATNLPDPRIAFVYDFGSEDGILYLAIHPSQDITLRHFLDQHKPLTPGQALPILTQLADVLDYVGDKGTFDRAIETDQVKLEDRSKTSSVTIADSDEVRQDRLKHEKYSLRYILALTALNLEMLSSGSSIDSQQPKPKSGHKTNGGSLSVQPQLLEKQIVESTQQHSEIMQILARAQQVRSPNDWLNVQALALQAMKRSEPGDGILEVLAEAAGALYQEKKVEAERLRLAELYEQGERALREKKWKSAVTAFEQVAQADPNYHEVSTMLEQAVAELERAELYDQAVRQAAEGEKVLASYNLLALLTDQWDYRQGEAVQSFIDVVEDLLDQLDQEQRRQQDETLGTDTISTKQTESLLEQYPNELTVTKEELDELGKQNNERREGMLGWDSKMLPHSSEAQLENTADDWLNKLTVNKTERLDALSEQETPTPTEDTENQIQDDNWLNELTTNKTERLDELPEQLSAAPTQAFESQMQDDYWTDKQLSKKTEHFEDVSLQKSENPTEVLDKWEQTSGWVNMQTANKTEKLDDFPDTASERREQNLNNSRISKGQDGKEMVRISAGEFLYGSGKELVQLDEFWIDKTPVTNAEYKRFLDAHPEHPVPYSEFDEATPFNWDRKTRTFPQGMANQPVVLVTLEDVQAYAKWAGKQLPSELEWEKAARGTDGRTYPWGKTWQASACNTKESGINSTTPVGHFSPVGDSPYGCVDMSGNVWEWTDSEYSDTTMVVRGGSWCNSHLDAWCMTRAGNETGAAKISVGFRLVVK